MSNSTWTIFPTIIGSRLIDVLPAESISDSKDPHIRRLLERHLFAQSIQIVSRNEKLFDSVRRYVIESNELAFLLLRDMPLYALICPHFIESYVAKGRAHGLSVNRDVNFDDTFALLPSGILLLSLNADTYYRLGIVGRESCLNRKKQIAKKYRITIDLRRECFKPGKKNYERIRECLRRSKLKCDFIVKWNAPADGGDISPNSLRKYFDHLKRNSFDDPLLAEIGIYRCYPSLRTFTNRSVTMPLPFNSFNSSSQKELYTEDKLNQFIDWTSAQVAQIEKWPDCSPNDDKENEKEVDIYCAELNGFFTGVNVGKLLEALKAESGDDQDQDQDRKTTNAIIVHGFENSPQCWSGTNNEHYAHLSGENVFGLGQLEGSKVISWCVADNYDFGIEKL